MDVAALTSLIGSVGFPIAMCLMMAFYIKGEQDKTREALTELTQAINLMTAEINRREGDKNDI